MTNALLTPMHVIFVQGSAYSTGLYRVSRAHACATFRESRPTGSSSIMHTITRKNQCDLDIWPWYSARFYYRLSRYTFVQISSS